MFTGIITDVGEITRVETRGDTRVVVATSYETLEIDLVTSAIPSTWPVTI